MSFEVRGEVLNADLFMGSWAPNGSSAVDATLNQGKNFSVTRTGVGTFSLVLLGLGGRRVRTMVGTLQLNASADSVVQFGAVTYSSTTGNATVVVRVLTAGSDADIAANANNRINFVITVS